MTESTAIMGSAGWWQEIINYEIISGITIWQFGLVLLIVLVSMVGGESSSLPCPHRHFM